MIDNFEVVDWIKVLRQQGFQLKKSGNNLKCFSPRDLLLTDNQKDIINKYKREILTLLDHEQQKQDWIPKTSDSQPLKLSFSQERLWFLDKYGMKDSAAYNIYYAINLVGALDVIAFNNSLNEVIARHSSLRTYFIEEAGIPAQKIIERIVINAVTEISDENITEWLQKEINRPFDLNIAPLFRVKLIKRGVDDYIFLLVKHHIISDGISVSIFMKELSELYFAKISQQTPVLKELSLQYSDYAQWQQSSAYLETLQKGLAYWTQQLKNYQTLNLATDYPRPVQQRHVGKIHSFKISAEKKNLLHQIAKKSGTTLFNALLAIFNILLSHYSGQKDIIIGIPIVNRPHEVLENVIGFFANTLVLRNDLTGEPSFTEFLSSVTKVFLSAYEHQDVPFEKIVDALHVVRDLSRNPLFQVLFSLQTFISGSELTLSNIELKPVYTNPTVSKFDLSLIMDEVPDGLVGSFEYNTDLFKESTIVQMAKCFGVLLTQITENPHQKIYSYSLLLEEDQQKLLQSMKPTKIVYPAETLFELFEQQAIKNAERIAVSCGEIQMSYAELNRRANQLAHYLQCQGVRQETLVGIAMDRSIDLIISMIAILKAGAAYVPLDTSYPAERLCYLMEDANLGFVLTQSNLLTQLPQTKAYKIVVDALVTQSAIATQDTKNLLATARPENLAYIIYTSGTTGQPKGVMVEHQQVTRLFKNTEDLFDFNQNDVWSLFHSYAFDFSVWEIWGALLYGGRIAIVPYYTTRSPEEFYVFLLKEQITVLNQTPSAFKALINYETDSSHEHHRDLNLRYVIFGGEALQPKMLRDWYLRHEEGQPKLINMYGITETTVHVTYHLIRKAEVFSDQNRSEIGTTLSDLSVYILDENEMLVPFGVPGELYVGGLGVTRGYLNRPQLTRERFINNPFTTDNNSKLYRSGDLARLTDSGLEYLGRIDNQIKLRGFRIELGEIEAAMTKHLAIKHAIVTLQEKHSDAKLIAYYVARGEINADNLRDFLKTQLPHYMIPNYFHALDDMPITTNGKIDKKRLPEIDLNKLQTTHTNVEPKTVEEKLLANIFCEVIGVKKIGIHDDFFNLGGNSLLSIQIIARIKATLNKVVPVRIIFDYPTINQLANYLTQDIAATKRNVINRVDRDSILPLSFSQERLWFLDQYEDKNLATYSIPIAIELQGELNLSALQKSLTALIKRHEILRTIFQQDSGKASQIILEKHVIDLYVEEIKETELDTVLDIEACAIFNLAQSPAFRIRLFKLTSDKHVLMINQHHIISDAWSLGILLKEWSYYYNQYCGSNIIELPPLPIQYADYAVWQRNILATDDLLKEVQYWKNKLADFKNLDITPDYPRTSSKTHNGSYYSFTLTRELTTAIQTFSRNSQSTLFMFLLAAFNILLNRYSRQEDIVVGTPIANRSEKSLENLIGFFVNTLALRVDLSGNPDFNELLQRVKQVCLEAYTHQQLPFEKLVDILGLARDVSRDPIFQVMLVLQQEDEVVFPEFTGLTAKALELQTNTAKFDLTLTVTEFSHQLHCALEYNTDLFAASTVARMAAHFQLLLQDIVSNPQQKINRYSILSDQERHCLLHDWNNTNDKITNESTLHALFIEQVKRTPHRTAVIFEDRALTYRELDETTTKLALYLREKLVTLTGRALQPDQLIGICVERSIEMIVGILGILKAGAAYVPLDPEYPAERLSYILNDTQLPLLLSTKKFFPTLQTVLGAEKIVALDDDWEKHAISVNSPLPEFSTVNNLIYVIYTSGSTGKPKGVMVQQNGVVNRLLWIRTQHQLSEQDTVLQKTPYGFDVSVWELFWPLTTGAKLCFAKPDGHKDPIYLAELVQQKNITIIHFVPSMLQVFLDELGSDISSRLQSIKQIYCSGEGLPSVLIKRCLELLPDVEIYNLYGPTEASIEVSYWNCKNNSYPYCPIQPIGKPISNIKLLVLDNQKQLVPIGVPGELYINGIGVARGYLNRDDLTQDNFIPNPFVTDDDRKQGKYLRLYKTGDLVRWLADGDIEYLGRVDDQVKIRGFRIELGEVERTLMQHVAIRQAVVVVKTRNHSKQLVAYFVAHPTNASDLTIDSLRNYLKTHLPEYMVPSFFIELQYFPLNSNGKVDKNLLPEPNINNLELDNIYIEPRSSTENTLASIWRELLEVDKVGIHDNFFSLGGDSIMSIQLVSRARHVGLFFTPKQVFTHPTIAELGKISTNKNSTDITLVHANAYVMRFNQEISEELKKSGMTTDEFSQVETILPLTPLQEGLLFHTLYAPESNQYYSQFNWIYHGVLDVRALKQAWEKLIQRHEILRSRYEWNGLSQPVQIIEKNVLSPWHEIDWSSLKELQLKKSLQEYIQKDLHTPFDLRQACLMRLHLIKLADNKHLFIWNYHHILLDGWSVTILFKELAAYYSALLTNQVLNLPSAISPANYVQWLQLQDKEQAKFFWRTQLTGIEEPSKPGINKKALDIYKPITRMGEVNSVVKKLKTKKYKDFSKQQKTTLNTLVQLAWSVVLAKYSATEQVIFGTTVAGRSGEIVGIENMVGLFINTVPMCVTIDQKKSVSEQLQTLHGKIQDINQYSYLTLNEIRDQSLISKNLPLFYTLLVFENYPASQQQLQQSELSITDMKTNGKTNYPLVILIEPSETLHIQAIYDADCFDKVDITRLVSHLKNCLDWIVENPQEKLTQVSFLTTVEQKKLTAFNNTQCQLNSTRCLHEVFAEQLSRTPTQLAVIAQDRQLTYAQLDQVAEKISERLKKLKVKTNTLVAVVASKGWEQVAAVIGILKAGAAYLPIATSEPTERLQSILQQGEVKIILSTDVDITSIQMPSDLTVLSVNQIEQDQPIQFISLKPIQQPSDLAYVIFTSGSTGVPKGVMITHQAVLNTIEDINLRFKVTVADKILGVSALNFDLSVYDIFGTLATGATLVLPTEADVSNPAALLHLIRTYKISLWNTVPALMQMLMDYVENIAEKNSEKYLASLRLILLSGDWIPLDLPQRIWRYTKQHTEVISLGGATEGSIWSILFPIKKIAHHWKSIPYGTPMYNQKFYVLDNHLNSVSLCVTGELCIGGIGVAAGYWKNPEKTAQHFVQLANGEKIYRTGDLGKLHSNGCIEFIGRKDTQVKIRGFRVELGEIEAVLLNHPLLKQSLILIDETQGQQRLIAFYVPMEINQNISSELKEFLTERLPNYMVPTAFVALPEFPLTANAKVDRKKLLQLAALVKNEDHDNVRPRDQIEYQLYRLWLEVLKLSDFGIQDDFVTLGGHSLLAIQLISKINQQFITQFPVSWIFTNNTISKQALILRNAITTPTTTSPIMCFNKKGTKTPLFLVHPGGGGAEAYFALAALFDPDQPVYAIDAHNLNIDTNPIESIEALAALYIKQLQSVRPHGPYFLGGWSFGGMIAFNMCQQLENQGEQVNNLYLLDSCLFDADLRNTFENIPWQKVYEILDKDDHYYQSLPIQYQKRFLNAFRAEVSAIKNYVSDYRATKGMLFKAMQAPKREENIFYRIETYFSLWNDIVKKPENGWLPYIEDLKIVEIDSIHHELLAEKNIAIIAQKIQQDMNKHQQVET